MNEVIEWSDIEAELNKGEQMGWQTVAQLAKVGQMLVAKKGDMPIREFVPHVGQHIPRLSKSTIHRYLMLAEHVHLLEQHKPDSQRAALALIQAANRPAPQPAPAPAPKPAPKPEPAPVRMTDEQANAAIEAAKVEANMSKSAGARFDAAVKKAVNIAFKQMRENFKEDLEKEKKAIQAEREKFFEQLEPERERLKAAEEKAKREKVHYENYNVSPPTLLTEEEFKLIRGCLHADRVPADLKERFDKAFVAFNRLAQWYENADKAMQRRRSELIEMGHRWDASIKEWERKEKAKQEAAKAKVEKDAKEMEAKWGVKL